MAVKASATVTLSCYRDTQSITRYYKLQSSTATAPSKPTTKVPSGWTDSEPSYTSGSTNTLYFCDLTVFSDGTWAYTTVSKSSSYEAAKEAYNKAVNAQNTASTANEKIDGLSIGGRNLILDSSFKNETSIDNTYQLYGNNSKKLINDNTEGTSLKYVSYTASVSNNKLTIGLDDAKGKDLVYSMWVYVEEATFSGYEFRIVYTKEDVNQWNAYVPSYPYNLPKPLSVGWNYLYGVYHISEDTTRLEVSFNIHCQAGVSGECWITSPKLEFGTRPTTWTKAPEDVDADIADANETGMDAQESANANEARIVNAESLIRQISDTISMLVVDESGESLMTQEGDRWLFNMASYDQTLRTVSGGLDDLVEEFGGTKNVVEVLQQAVDDLGLITDYIAITTYNDQPCIELGETDSNFKLRITNTEIQFIDGTNIPAYMNNQKLYIDKAEITGEFQQGGFIWKQRSNGNLGLIWKGVGN